VDPCEIARNGGDRYSANAHKCGKCGAPVHLPCCKGLGQDAYKKGARLRCLRCHSEEVATAAENSAKECQKNAEKNMSGGKNREKAKAAENSAKDGVNNTEKIPGSHRNAYARCRNIF